MAASVQYSGLASAGAQSGGHRVPQRNYALPQTSLDFGQMVAASSNRSSRQNEAATVTAGALGRSGIEGTAALGAQSLRSQSDLAATGMQASTSAFNAKTQADALIEREKIARGESPMDYLRLAGGIGLAATGMQA
jgi:hypothetical protein